MPAPAAPNPLLDQLDITPHPKPFKVSHYKSAPRRNKNLKQLLSSASGTTTPTSTTDPSRLAPPPPPPTFSGPTSAPAQSVPTSATATAMTTAPGGAPGGVGAAGGMATTYANIESAPSLVRGKKWCDVTGLPAKYTDPKTKLRYADGEVFQALRQLPAGGADRYLEIRGANIILK